MQETVYQEVEGIQEDSILASRKEPSWVTLSIGWTGNMGQCGSIA